MKNVLKHPLGDSPDNLMKRVGYVRHCTEAGRACFHKRLNDPPYPRFHAFVSVNDKGMEVDLHFDQFDSLTHKGNHDKDWAYQGGRVSGEMERIFQILRGEIGPKKVNQSTNRKISTPKPASKKKSLLDIFLK